MGYINYTLKATMSPRLTPRGSPQRPKTERLAAIERLLWWRGWVRRSDLMKRFGVSEIQASLDLRLFRKLNPGAMRYDRGAARYVAASRLSLKANAGQLDEAVDVMRFTERRADRGAWFQRAALPTRRIEGAIAQTVVRAILSESALHIHYASVNSNSFRWRWISPHALGHDGFRWHVRAFCHDERRFRDFVLGRFAATGDTGPAAGEPADDVEWTRSVELRLKVDPGLGAGQRRALELDFMLEAGQLKVQGPVALMTYALAALGVAADGGGLRPQFRLCESRISHVA